MLRIVPLGCTKKPVLGLKCCAILALGDMPTTSCPFLNNSTSTIHWVGYIYTPKCVFRSIWSMIEHQLSYCLVVHIGREAATRTIATTHTCRLTISTAYTGCTSLCVSLCGHIYQNKTGHITVRYRIQPHNWIKTTRTNKSTTEELFIIKSGKMR